MPVQPEIILVQPPSREQGKLIYPPMGLMAASALVDAAGVPVEILDGNVIGQRAVEERLREAQPRIVGITSFTGPMLRAALEISDFAKRNTPATVVWGGVHASILPEQTLANDCVDVVVRFEGDQTLLQIHENLDDLEKVPGIAFEKDGQVVVNPQAGLLPDLGVLPPFPWHLVDAEHYVIPWAQADRTLPVISSRGCPYRCSFCYNLVFNDQRWRGFPLDRVTAEIDYLVDRYRLTGLRLDASDLFIGPGKPGREHALSIVRHAHGHGLKWAAQLRTNQVDEDLLREFKALGCNYLFYGLESGSKRILKEIYKDVRVDHIKKIVDLTNSLGIMCAAGIMYDFPGETYEEFRETVRLFQQARILVRFSALQPYPGTPVFEYVRDKGLFDFPKDTLGWCDFEYDHPHGLSDIPRVRERAGLWNLKYNYGHNLLVTLRRRDWFFLRTMSRSFLDYAIQERREFMGGRSFELNY
jgi:radical SAM superfamily enzyme YgiQ (UPF0313 family)